MKTEEKKEIDLLDVVRKLDVLLAQNTEKVKRELLKKPLSNEEFIKQMRISSRTAQNWRDKGIISFHKIGEKIYYTWDDILKMLETHRVKSFKGL